MVAALALLALVGPDIVYHPELVEIGQTLHYVRSNLDGTNSEHVVVYTAAPDRYVAYKFQDQGGRAARVTTAMDWGTFSARELTSEQVQEGAAQLVARLAVTRKGKAIDVEVVPMARKESVPLTRGAWHLYNADLVSLMAVLPHWRTPERTMKFRLLDPNFGEGSLIVDRGQMLMAYVGEEVRQDILTRKYTLTGEAWPGKVGYLWVARDGSYLVEAQSPLPNHPGMSSFKLQLRSRANRTPESLHAWLKIEAGQDVDPR